MLVRVYHDRQHVATVDAPTEEIPFALQCAWRRTNNIKGAWSWGERFPDGSPNPDYSGNVKVHILPPVYKVNGYSIYGLRSSMMGDFFVVNDQTYRMTYDGFRSA
jgi:hypothetical protein